MGVTTVKSLRCPEVSQGSLLIKLSPSCKVSQGYSLRKWRTAIAIVLICPGVPVTAWAIIFPRVSNTPAERSPASRTTVVNEAFCKAVACSLTIEIRRFHKISKEIGSISSGVRETTSEVRSLKSEVKGESEVRGPRSEGGGVVRAI